MDSTPGPAATPRPGPPPLPIQLETSAGGLIVDLKHDPPRAAIIARHNRAGRLEWCLPKGHLEGEETAPEAAVREIAEETGITGSVVASLGSIDYWFASTENRIHKTVHHFVLQAVSGELTAENDPDGEVVDVAWVPLSEVTTTLAYPNERRLANKAIDIIMQSTDTPESSG